MSVSVITPAPGIWIILIAGELSAVCDTDEAIALLDSLTMFDPLLALSVRGLERSA